MQFGGKALMSRMINIYSTAIFILSMVIHAGTGWGMDEHGVSMKKGNDHSSHRFTFGKQKTRTVVKYTIPDVVLLTQEGNKVNLDSFLRKDKVVLVDFIFSTCSTICPLLSAGFAHFQDELGPHRKDVQLVSITIDPEYDTPEILDQYGERYDAEEGWTFLTGDMKDIVKVMHAFDAYVPNKMNHYPLTFLRAPGQDDWVRIDGLMSGSELMKEYDAAVKK